MHHPSPPIRYTQHHQLVRHHTAPPASSIDPSSFTVLIPPPPPPAPVGAIFVAAPSVLDSPPLGLSRFEPPITPPLSNTYSRRGSFGEQEMPGHHSYGRRVVEPSMMRELTSHHGRTLGRAYSGDSVTHVVAPGSLTSYGPAPLGRSGSYDAGYEGSINRGRSYVVPERTVRVVRRHTDDYIEDQPRGGFVLPPRPSQRQKPTHLVRRAPVDLADRVDNLPTGKHTTLSERVSKFVNTLNPSIPDVPEEQGHVMQPNTIPCDPETLPMKPRRKSPRGYEEDRPGWMERGVQYPGGYSREEAEVGKVRRSRRRYEDDEVEDCARRMLYLRT